MIIKSNFVFLLTFLYTRVGLWADETHFLLLFLYTKILCYEVEFLASCRICWELNFAPKPRFHCIWGKSVRANDASIGATFCVLLMWYI